MQLASGTAALEARVCCNSDNGDNGHFYSAWSLAKPTAQCAVQIDEGERERQTNRQTDRHRERETHTHRDTERE